MYLDDKAARFVVDRIEVGQVVPLCQETAYTRHAEQLHHVLADLVVLVESESASVRVSTVKAAIRNARELVKAVEMERTS